MHISIDKVCVQHNYTHAGVSVRPYEVKELPEGLARLRLVLGFPGRKISVQASRMGDGPTGPDALSEGAVVSGTHDR